MKKKFTNTLFAMIINHNLSALLRPRTEQPEIIITSGSNVIVFNYEPSLQLTYDEQQPITIGHINLPSTPGANTPVPGNILYGYKNTQTRNESGRPNVNCK